MSRPALYIEAVSSRLTFGFCIAAGGAKVDVTGWKPIGCAKTRPEKRVLIRNTPAMRGERPLRKSVLSFMFELLKLSILVKILKHLILSFHYIIFGAVMSTKFQRNQLLAYPNPIQWVAHVIVYHNIRFIVSSQCNILVILMSQSVLEDYQGLDMI